jgi:hypothetical protein
MLPQMKKQEESSGFTSEGAILAINVFNETCSKMSQIYFRKG